MVDLEKEATVRRSFVISLADLLYVTNLVSAEHERVSRKRGAGNGELEKVSRNGEEERVSRKVRVVKKPTLKEKRAAERSKG